MKTSTSKKETPVRSRRGPAWAYQHLRDGEGMRSASPCPLSQSGQEDQMKQRFSLAIRRQERSQRGLLCGSVRLDEASLVFFEAGERYRCFTDRSFFRCCTEDQIDTYHDFPVSKTPFRIPHLSPVSERAFVLHTTVALILSNPRKPLRHLSLRVQRPMIPTHTTLVDVHAIDHSL